MEFIHEYSSLFYEIQVKFYHLLLNYFLKRESCDKIFENYLKVVFSYIGYNQQF